MPFKHIKTPVYELFGELGIQYEKHDHEAIFTMEEIHNANLDPDGYIAKNLFLRDGNGKRHMLVTVSDGKTPDLKVLRNIFQSSRLSFGSEERLMDRLGLTKGSVSPMGLINDKDNAVEFYFDKDLLNRELIGIHPNHNTSTVFLKPADLIRAIEHTGHKVIFIEI
ncbi:MAG: prolyl-tRNA synthetase associated domain-containing protein [Anaerofustis stercorihominis]|nr:prolyl-tRNA synthetase associated domain-containing protein [Anaerofustis stercorihominis]